MSSGIRGFSLTLLHSDGREMMYLGGEYMHDREAARRMALRMSWELTDAEGTNGVSTRGRHPFC